MLFRLFLFIWLSFQTAGFSAQSRALPSPDAYPADSLLVLLREDTVAQELKVWIVNRLDDTVAVSTPMGYPINWLEVRDENGEWQCYNYRSTSLWCGTGVQEFINLTPDTFTKAELRYSRGDFATQMRALFIVNDSIRYSAIMPISVDPLDIDDPDRMLLKQLIGSAYGDSVRLSNAYTIYGSMIIKKEKYEASQEAFARALELDSTNYRALISQGNLKIRMASRAGLNEKKMSEQIKAVSNTFRVIPASEGEMQRKIQRWREVYAKWLK